MWILIDYFMHLVKPCVPINSYLKEKYIDFEASKEVGLEVNTKKTKYMLLSRHQNAGKNHDIRIGNI
jgi:di/tripeptidase